MKYIIASDIHGSAKATRQIVALANKENADKIILLGDVYNHGPRNILPEEYAPMQVAEILNAITDKLIVIKGNCDSEVDKMISKFDFLDTSCLVVNGKTVLLTHGHIYNPQTPPAFSYDVMLYGHFHTCKIERNGNKIEVNVGSVSLPKNDTPKSLVIIDDATLKLVDLDGNIIDEISL
jgi:putative phosphoesterase